MRYKSQPQLWYQRRSRYYKKLLSRLGQMPRVSANKVISGISGAACGGRDIRHSNATSAVSLCYRVLREDVGMRLLAKHIALQHCHRYVMPRPAREHRHYEAVLYVVVNMYVTRRKTNVWTLAYVHLLALPCIRRLRDVPLKTQATDDTQ